MQITAFWCIFIIFIAFHPDAFFTGCMVLHIIAFICIHVWCILILMHSLTFIRIFNAAFGTRCIHVHLNASFFGCIFLACCILVHSLHKMHSCAFFVCCILYMPHLNAFQYILSLDLGAFWMCCILPVMHLNASLCIPVHLGGKIPDFDERRDAILLASWCLRMHMDANVHECTWMRQNASECARIHQGPHTYLHKREAERTQGQTHMDGYGLDGLWACHKACHKSTHVPLHVIHRMHTRVSIHEWMHLCTLVNACVSECIWMRLNA